MRVRNPQVRAQTRVATGRRTLKEQYYHGPGGNKRPLTATPVLAYLAIRTETSASSKA